MKLIKKRDLQDIVPNDELREELEYATELGLKVLDYRSKMEYSSNGHVKATTLEILAACENGVSISELIRIRDFRIAFLQEEGRVPTRKNLSMRLLRYSRQGLLKRRRVYGEYRYFLTEKGLEYEHESLADKVEKVFNLVRNDSVYRFLISDFRIDEELKRLFIKYAEQLEEKIMDF